MIITIIHWKNCILKQKKNDSFFFLSLFKKEPVSAYFVPPIITLSQERCI